MADKPEKPPDPRVPGSNSGMAEVLRRITGSKSHEFLDETGKPVATLIDKPSPVPSLERPHAPPHTERPGTKTLDYIALGLLLAPPAVVVDMYLKGTSIDWRKTAIAVVACWTAGGVTVWASHAWQSWHPRNWRVLPYLIAAESNFWGKAVIVAAAIGGALALSSVLSNNENLPTQQPIGFTQQQVDEKIAAATAPIKRQLDESNKELQNTRGIIVGLQGELVDMTRQRDALRQVQPQPPEAKSTFLGLDDTERWRLSVALQDALRNSHSICDAHLWGKPSSDTSAAFWKEFQPILAYSGWLLQGGPTPKTVFPDGVTLSVGSDHGGSFDCAYRLSELLEKLTVRPVTLRVNQTTPDLIACKNTCLEMVVGDVAVH